MGEVRNFRPLASAKEAKERKEEDPRIWVLVMLPALLNQHTFIRISKELF